MKIKDTPANPAHIGMPDTNNAKALPNKRTARASSLIAGYPLRYL
jgi:hypothetical protein